MTVPWIHVFVLGLITLIGQVHSSRINENDTNGTILFDHKAKRLNEHWKAKVT
jgi:hypothetical protein